MDVISLNYAVQVLPAAGSRSFRDVILLTTFFESLQGKYLTGLYANVIIRPIDATEPSAVSAMASITLNTNDSRALGNLIINPFNFIPNSIPIRAAGINTLTVDYSSDLVIDSLQDIFVTIDFFFEDKPITTLPNIFE